MESSCLAGLALLAVGFGFLRMLYWFLRAIAAGRYFHDTALQRLINAPIRFFDTNPVGRILNRFAYDMDTLEAEVPRCFEQMTWSFISAGIVFLAMIVIVPWALLVVVPGLAVFYILQRNFRAAARDMKRMTSITRSPRFAHFKETLEGLDSIRAFGQQDWFWEKQHATLQAFQRAFHGSLLLNRWFSVRLPLITGSFNIAAIMFAVVLSTYGMMSAGSAGLLLIFSFLFTDHLTWFVRMFAETESRMTSVERVHHYTTLPQEKAVVSAKVMPEKTHWPLNGAVEFRDVKARYAVGLPLVLDGVSFQIPPGARVGVIGRTGAGKSTLLQTLFRLVEIESGQITVDGWDIAQIPAERLRQAIAIIPQDPVLYLGTLRNNLDRFGEWDDVKLWQILRQVGLGDFMAEKGYTLDSEVVENGQNFSLGQKQLICLARALLQRSSVVVMDEATASVDSKTDQLIQSAIRTNFQDRTLIIIAHRLGTLKGCDFVIEMAAGKVARIIRQDPRPRRPGRQLSHVIAQL